VWAKECCDTWLGHRATASHSAEANLAWSATAMLTTLETSTRGGRRQATCSSLTAEPSTGRVVVNQLSLYQQPRRNTWRQRMRRRRHCGYATLTATTIKILEDNQGAIKLIKNPIASVRSKHIDVIYHIVRERAARKEVEFEYISTDKMIADVFTKAVPLPKLTFCLEGMGVH
jgi:hypothetical protein